MFVRRIVLCVCVCVASSVADGDRQGPVVSSPLGHLRGFYITTRGGRRISAFTSVPYAQPPIGELRFKRPVSVHPWGSDTGEIFEANLPSPPCVQRNPYTREQDIRGQEDCLYLNIYTPYDTHNRNTDRLLPVMVWLHGGGWMCGDSSTEMYGPEYLLDHDVLLVAVNYRLGPLGFLSTGDEVCPGNNGLKDQQEALRFIQKNIHSFGGDNSSVTIFGESAGGVSVHYHMLSPTSAGLFHKAISQSGTALAPWAESPPGESLRHAFRLAKYLDCPQAPSADMIACLRTKDSYEIIDTEFLFYEWDYEPMTPFKAVVEPDLPGAFLTRSPREHVPANKIPWLTGLNKDEGCLKSVWITSNNTRLKQFLSGLERIAPVTFYYENSPLAADITQSLRDQYLSDTTRNEDSAVLRMFSDSYFNYPLVEAIDLTLQWSKSPIFVYELTYRATNSFSQIFGDDHKDYGVCHADDLMHLFPIRFLSQQPSQKDREFSDLMLTLWSNFATSGDPNQPIEAPGMASINWSPTTAKQLDYLDIGSQPQMRKQLAEKSRFWGKLPLWHSFVHQKSPTRYQDEL